MLRPPHVIELVSLGRIAVHCSSVESLSV